MWSSRTTTGVNTSRAVRATSKCTLVRKLRKQKTSIHLGDYRKSPESPRRVYKAPRNIRKVPSSIRKVLRVDTRRVPRDIRKVLKENSTPAVAPASAARWDSTRLLKRIAPTGTQSTRSSKDRGASFRLLDAGVNKTRFISVTR